VLFPEGTHWYYKNNKQSLPQAKVAIVVLVWREDDEADKVPTIMIAKMNFSQRIFDQKRPVFLQYTQCSDYRETMRTWLGGGGFVGAVGVLEGGAMVMVWFHVAHCVESYAFHPGTSWAKMHSGPTCTKMKRIEIV